jgi:hypothetical protein
MSSSGVVKKDELAIIRCISQPHGHETPSVAIFRGHEAALADDASPQTLLVPVESSILPWGQTRVASGELHVPLSQVGATHLRTGGGEEEKREGRKEKREGRNENSDSE